MRRDGPVRQRLETLAILFANKSSAHGIVDGSGRR
jgi:hypothetical protein